MNDDFRDHMRGAIASAPNEKIAQQLQLLLDRLEATNGFVNPRMPIPAPMPVPD